jgi:hypothetical protein
MMNINDFGMVPLVQSLPFGGVGVNALAQKNFCTLSTFPRILPLTFVPPELQNLDCWDFFFFGLQKAS